MVCFTRCVGRIVWSCNVDKCCVVTHRAADIRVAWLVYLVCLGSQVLRAYCNFESKQAISSTNVTKTGNGELKSWNE